MLATKKERLNMTIRDLFNCMNTDVPRIMIYDHEENVIFEKHSNKPIGKLPLWEKNVAWIYRADGTEVAVRIEQE